MQKHLNGILVAAHQFSGVAPQQVHSTGFRVSDHASVGEGVGLAGLREMVSRLESDVVGLASSCKKLVSAVGSTG